MLLAQLRPMLILAACLIATAQPAQAQGQMGPDDGEGGPVHEDGFEFELGAGAFYSPDYTGSDDYRISPVPWASLTYRQGERYIEVSGPSLKANIIGSDAFQFGPTLGYEMGRDRSVRSTAVENLGKIDSALMAGAFFGTGIDLGGGSSLQFDVDGAFDLGHTNDGARVKVEAGYQRMLGERWMLSAGVGTQWADENYTQTYYGVSNAGAAASGLPAFAAQGGFEYAELSMGAFYRASERLNIMAMAGYQRLLGSAADSPIVRIEGDPNQFSFGLIAVRRF